jgi:BirA family biotin operon repressor/biotin-[acetyl-CoA-carboxylase] ligase
MELLNSAAIEQHLSADAKRYFSPIEIFPELDSTNTYLLNKHETGAVCLAEQQTAGRGRQGREWISPYARNIYLSVLGEVPNTPSVSGLSLVAGLSVIQALNALGVEDLRIKWPNDIVYKERKLAGILLEVARHTATTVQVVIGIGINVDMPQDANINQPWIDVKTLRPQPLSRNEMVGHLLNVLYAQIKAFNTQQLTAVLQQWPLLDALHDKPVNIQQGAQLLTGVAKGINAQGMLQLQQGEKILTIGSGEVTQLRAQNQL